MTSTPAAAISSAASRSARSTSSRGLTLHPSEPLPGTGSYALTSSIRAPTVAASRVAWRTASRAVSDPSVPTTMAEYIRAASYGDA